MGEEGKKVMPNFAAWITKRTKPEYVCMYWSKPGSINTPQKQDENRGFGPGQAAGRTPGKLGGNMPVKLAKIRGKKEQQTE